MLEYIIYTNNIYKGVGGMSQSISDVAKLYNVSINTIGYHMKRNELEFEYIGGKRFISDEHIKQLSNYINVEHTSNVGDKDNNKNTTSNNYNIDPIAILQSHITLLSSQLDKKDNQLDKAQELIDQQQRLAIDQSNKVRELEKELKVYKQLEYNKEVQQQEVATNTKQDVEDADVKDVSNNNQPVEESNSVDNRSIKVKRYKVYSPTDDPVDVSNQTDTNIEDTEPNKRKGFFARLFNL